MKNLIIYLLLVIISFGECTVSNYIFSFPVHNTGTSTTFHLNNTNTSNYVENRLILCDSAKCKIGIQCNNMIFIQHNNTIEIINKGISSTSVTLDKMFYNNSIKYQTKKTQWNKELTIISKDESKHIFIVPFEILELLEQLLDLLMISNQPSKD